MIIRLFIFEVTGVTKKIQVGWYEHIEIKDECYVGKKGARKKTVKLCE